MPIKRRVITFPTDYVPGLAIGAQDESGPSLDLRVMMAPLYRAVQAFDYLVRQAHDSHIEASTLEVSAKARLDEISDKKSPEAIKAAEDLMQVTAIYAESSTYWVAAHTVWEFFPEIRGLREHPETARKALHVSAPVGPALKEGDSKSEGPAEQ